MGHKFAIRRFSFAPGERGGYILTPIEEPPSTHFASSILAVRQYLDRVSKKPPFSRARTSTIHLAKATQRMATVLLRRLDRRKTIAHAPTMAKSAIMLALAVAMINIFLLSNDSIMAASNNPWDNYADVNPTQSEAAIKEISAATPLLKNIDPATVAVALSDNGSSDFLAKATDGQQTTQATQLSQTYIVVKGDTLSSIADHFQLHTASILAANEISPDPAVINLIKPGDKLTIPAVDISNSNDWLVAINDAAKQQAAAAAAAAQAAAAKKAKTTTTTKTATSSSSTASTGSHPHSGTYVYGYCTDLAAALRPDLPGNLGNAGTWVRNARAQGFSTGSSPKKNAVVQLAEGWIGHVAVVTSVNDDSITIIERNYKGWNIDDYRTISINSGDIVGYIY